MYFCRLHGNPLIYVGLGVSFLTPCLKPSAIFMTGAKLKCINEYMIKDKQEQSHKNKQLK